MVISPLLRGLFGLSVDESASLVTLSPHIPANWKTFAIRNVHTGPCVMDIRYKRTDTEMSIDTNRPGSGECTLEFSPAISPLAEVTGAEMNGHLVNYRMLKSADDQHVVVRYAVPHGAAHLSIMIRNDFGLSWDAALPALGSTSHGLRVLNGTWSANHDLLELQIAGAAGSTYELGVWNAGMLTRVEGAELVKAASDPSLLRVRISASAPGGYARQKISLHFSGKSAP
jgi:hypothetical protein